MSKAPDLPCCTRITLLLAAVAIGSTLALVKNSSKDCVFDRDGTRRCDMNYNVLSLIITHSVLLAVFAFLYLLFAPRQRRHLPLLAHRQSILLTIPSAIACSVGDAIELFVIGKHGATIYLVLSQVRPLIAGVCGRWILKKHFSTVQWCMLLMVTTMAMLYTVGAARSGGTTLPWVVAMVFLKNVLSVFSGIFTERAFAKNEIDLPMPINHIHCQTIVVALCLLMTCFDPSFSWKHFFHGWDVRVWAVNFGMIFNAMIVVLVFKRLDAVTRFVSGSASLVVVYFYCCFSGELEYQHQQALICVLLLFFSVLYVVVSPNSNDRERKRSNDFNLAILKTDLDDEEAILLEF